MSKRTHTAFSLLAELHLRYTRELIGDHKIAVLSVRGEVNVKADQIWEHVEYHLGRVIELMELHQKSIDNALHREVKELVDAIWDIGIHNLTKNARRGSQSN